MTQNYFKNLYMKAKLTEQELQDIPQPRFEVHYHVVNKCAQAGSVIGMFVLGPLVGALRKGNSERGVLSRMFHGSIRGGRLGMFLLIPLAPLMTEAALQNATQDAVYDRAYRLRKNENQNNVDRFATAGGLTLGGISMLFGPGLFTGLSTGIAIGTVGAAVFNTKNKHKEQ